MDNNPDRVKIIHSESIIELDRQSRELKDQGYMCHSGSNLFLNPKKKDYITDYVRIFYLPEKSKNTDNTDIKDNKETQENKEDKDN
jgi:hypothetical protein